jgi:hypothetical protein
MVETTSEDFTYCALSPEHINTNGDVEGGNAYGVGPESDSTGVYDSIFGANNDMYEILSMCIFEVCIFLTLLNQFQLF